VSDTGNPPLSSSAQIQVNITDVNDEPPRFTQSSYIVTVPENVNPTSLNPQLLQNLLYTDGDTLPQNTRSTFTILMTTPTPLMSSESAITLFNECLCSSCHVVMVVAMCCSPWQPVHTCHSHGCQDGSALPQQRRRL